MRENYNSIKIPTVNESEIVVLLKHVWVYAKNKEGFGRRRRKNKFERKTKRTKTENSHNMFLFIARVLSTYYLLYFFIIL